MKITRPSDRGGRYVPDFLSEGIFSPGQTRFLLGELRKIAETIANHDRGFYPRWDDLKFPFTQTRRGATLKPDFDTTNIGLLFPQNDPSEIVYIVGQMPHGYVSGAELRPHIHWQQTGATFPTWKMEYKWFNNGDPVPATFTTLSTDTGAFTYDSGNLCQISGFDAIDGEDMKASSILLIKVYRDDNVVSGDVLGFEFDIHFKRDEPGTTTEYGRLLATEAASSTGFPYTFPFDLE